MNLFDNASITYTDNSSSWTEYRDSINPPYYIIWKTNGLKTVNNLQLTGVFDNSQYMPKQFDIISYNGTIADFENTSRVDNLQAINWNTITSINETIGYDQQLTKTYDFNNHDVSYIGIKVNQNFVDSSNSNVYINDVNWRFQTTLIETSPIHNMHIPQKDTFPKDHPEEIARRSRRRLPTRRHSDHWIRSKRVD